MRFRGARPAPALSRREVAAAAAFRRHHIHHRNASADKRLQHTEIPAQLRHSSVWQPARAPCRLHPSPMGWAGAARPRTGPLARLLLEAAVPPEQSPATMMAATRSRCGCTRAPAPLPPPAPPPVPPAQPSPLVFADLQRCHLVCRRQVFDRRNRRGCGGRRWGQPSQISHGKLTYVARGRWRQRRRPSSTIGAHFATGAFFELRGVALSVFFFALKSGEAGRLRPV